MFDGALGVLAGIEAIQTLRENGYQNHYSMEVIAFTEEEGNVIGGTFGSKAFAGVDQEEDVMRKILFMVWIHEAFKVQKEALRTINVI